jgi:hypothetical protein
VNAIDNAPATTAHLAEQLLRIPEALPRLSTPSKCAGMKTSSSSRPREKVCRTRVLSYERLIQREVIDGFDEHTI